MLYVMSLQLSFLEVIRLMEYRKEVSRDGCDDLP